MSYPPREDTSASVAKVTIDPVAFNEIRSLGDGQEPASLIEAVDQFAQETETQFIRAGFKADNKAKGHPVGTVPTTLDAATVGRLAQLGRQTGEDLVDQLAKLFVTEADTRMAALRAALAQADRAAVAMNSHTLNGASGCLGATELARLCALLEQGCSTDTLEVIGVSLDEIGAEIGRVRAALDERSYS